MEKDISKLIGENLSKDEALNKSRRDICIKYFNEIKYDDLKEIFIKMLNENIAPDYIYNKLDKDLDKKIINRFKNRHNFSNDFICMNILLNELIIESYNRASMEIITCLEKEDFGKIEEIVNFQITKIKEEA